MSTGTRDKRESLIFCCEQRASSWGRYPSLSVVDIYMLKVPSSSSSSTSSSTHCRYPLHHILGRAPTAVVRCLSGAEICSNERRHNSGKRSNQQTTAGPLHPPLTPSDTEMDTKETEYRPGGARRPGVLDEDENSPTLQHHLFQPSPTHRRLEEENERLRGELRTLQTELGRMRRHPGWEQQPWDASERRPSGPAQQQHPAAHPPHKVYPLSPSSLPLLPSPAGTAGRRTGAVGDLPPTGRRPGRQKPSRSDDDADDRDGGDGDDSGDDDQPGGNSLLCFRSRPRQQQQQWQPPPVGVRRDLKAHPSISNDSDSDQEPVESYVVDMESHQSALGLHHRSQGHTNGDFHRVGGARANKSPPVRGQSSVVRIAGAAPPSHPRPMDPVTGASLAYSGGDGSDLSDGASLDSSLVESQGLIGGRHNGRPKRRSRHKSNGTPDGMLVAHGGPTGRHAKPVRNHLPGEMPFCRSVADRAGWLVGLLVFQSLSSFILARHESLLKRHTVIVQFLTMLVGAGGNAGNQASVGVVRGLAVGSIDRTNVRQFLGRELAMGAALSVLLGVAGFVRATAFSVPPPEAAAITASLVLIVVISVAAGAALPLAMDLVGIDPAHSSTTIQVVMDITGVFITVGVSSLVLDSDFVGRLEAAGL